MTPSPLVSIYSIPLKLSLIFLFNSLLTWSLPIGERAVNDKWLILNSLWKSSQWLSFEPIDRTSLSLAAAGKTIASWHSLAAETQTHTHTSACTHTHVVMNNPWWSKGQEPCVWKINSTQGLMTAGKKENRKAEARETYTHIPLSDCTSVRECGVLQLSGSVRVRENYLRWHENCCLYSWLRKQQCCVCLYDDILLARRAQRVFPDVFFFTFW